MRQLQVRVLLDTGPTETEVGEIRGMFAKLGMDAVPEGHSYGGPPPTSAFLIVINGPLGPLLDRVADPGWGGPAAFAQLVQRLQEMRADRRRWGRPHGVKLEDSHSGHGVSLPGGLPSAAYLALAEVDLSGLDRSAEPVELVWSEPLHRWQARLTTAPRRVARRVPVRARDTDTIGVRQVDEAEVERLWRLTEQAATPAVSWQRAAIVLASALGSGVAVIAQRMLVSPARIRAVIRNFNQDGFASLAPTYRGGEPVRPGETEARDAARIAAEPPSTYGLSAATWEPALLGEFLVSEGVVEDIDPAWLESLPGSVEGPHD